MRTDLIDLTPLAQPFNTSVTLDKLFSLFSYSLTQFIYLQMAGVIGLVMRIVVV